MKRYNFDRVIDRSGTQAKKLLQLPKGAPDDVLSLWIADMDFACADPILEALHRRIDEGIFGYTQYKTPECMAAITGWFFRRFGWEIDPGEIFFSPGVVPALGALISILSDEGDGIVIQNPVYGPFAGKIAGNGRPGGSESADLPRRRLHDGFRRSCSQTGRSHRQRDDPLQPSQPFRTGLDAGGAENRRLPLRSTG